MDYTNGDNVPTYPAVYVVVDNENRAVVAGYSCNPNVRLHSKQFRRKLEAFHGPFSVEWADPCDAPDRALVKLLDGRETLLKHTKRYQVVPDQPAWVRRVMTEMLSADSYALSKATGLNYNWLRSLQAGNVADPGVNKIWALAKHLGIVDDI